MNIREYLCQYPILERRIGDGYVWFKETNYAVVLRLDKPHRLMIGKQKRPNESCIYSDTCLTGQQVLESPEMPEFIKDFVLFHVDLFSKYIAEEEW